MKNHVPKPQDEPRPEMVVAVRDLTALRLMVIKPEGRYQTGDMLPIYGGTLDDTGNFKSIYRPGSMPSAFRSGVEDEETEIRFCDIPGKIEETNLEECPGAFMVVLTEYDFVARPIPEGGPECKVIQHPAVYFNRVQPRAKPLKVDPAQQCFPFAEPNYKPYNELIA